MHTLSLQSQESPAWTRVLSSIKGGKSLLLWCIFIIAVTQNTFLARVPGTAACHAYNRREPRCKITSCISSNRELLQKRNSTAGDRGVIRNTGGIVCKVFALSWCVKQSQGAGGIWGTHLFLWRSRSSELRKRLAILLFLSQPNNFLRFSVIWNSTFQLGVWAFCFTISGKATLILFHCFFFLVLLNISPICIYFRQKEHDPGCFHVD